MAVETLPSWANDLSWVEEAYSTVEGRCKITEITKEVFTARPRNPELIRKAYEILQQGVALNASTAKCLLIFWRTKGYGLTFEGEFREFRTFTWPDDLTNCRISVEILRDCGQDERDLALESFIEVLKIDKIIQKLFLINLPRLGDFEGLLASKPHLTKLSIDVSQLPTPEVCKLFFGIAKSNSIRQLMLFCNPIYDRTRAKDGNITGIQESVAAMLRESTSLRSLRIKKEPFIQRVKVVAFFMGLCSISKNNSLQKLKLDGFKALLCLKKGTLAPPICNTFVQSLAQNRSLKSLRLHANVYIMMRLLDNLKTEENENIQTLIMAPKRSPLEYPIDELEIDSMFSKLAENRTLRNLTIDVCHLEDPLDERCKSRSLWLAAIRPSLGQISVIHSGTSWAHSEIAQELETIKSRHPSLMRTLLERV